MNYYNEFDPKAAAWLQELINQNLIPQGVVDTRSIEDVKPDELKEYIQCHFFAGIGGWPLALQLAGWPDDRPVWTGSCPCQPFSAAGQGKGVDDERHLWPAFQWLISQCKPPVVFGEQVASKAGRAWLSDVRADLEALEYGVGAADLCAAGAGAPHIRQRLFWVADSDEQQRDGGRDAGAARGSEPTDRRPDGRLGDSQREGLEGYPGDGDGAPGRQEPGGPATETGGNGGLADTDIGQCDRIAEHGENVLDRETGGRVKRNGEFAGGGKADSAPAPDGPWRAVDWLGCRDGKWRPVEPGTFPLAHGVPARVGRLRGYGNAIVPQVAQAFIEAYGEA